MATAALAARMTRQQIEECLTGYAAALAIARDRGQAHTVARVLANVDELLDEILDRDGGTVCR